MFPLQSAVLTACCTAYVTAPFCSVSSCRRFLVLFSALQMYLNTPRISHRSLLHRSVTHPLSPALSYSQSFILTSSRFDSAIWLFTPALIHSESSSSMLSLLTPPPAR